MLLDGTFATDVSLKNVERAVGRGRKVGIIYIYQDPIIAWDFTKKRERLEGRDVPKEIFIKYFFEARENVKRVKEQFGKLISVDIVINDADNKMKDY